MIIRLLAKLPRLLLFIVVMLILTSTLQPIYAQPGGGNPCPGGEPCDPEAPITGIEWLLLGGAAFGARKVYAKFKKPV